ncbi:hypothetical protein UFOVP75_145 [uncultured Caudovirales phage]|uniref:Uncharacterized protein n=1 Tax=uncultured Caudovirales phage TaxID=2100421 RepID=A0A6J5L164_9CAUD|nr:hypothetical protein UFOVP75_145 [uncultured Caudovirales phage]
MEIKQNAALRLTVKLVNSSGVPVNSVAATSVTASIIKGDGTAVALTVNSGNWVQVTSNAFASQGVYTLTLPTSATSVLGPLITAVVISGAVTVVDTTRVIANEVADAVTGISGVQTTVNSTATQAGLDAVNTNIAQADARVQSLTDTVNTLFTLQNGRWKIFSSGPDINRMVIFANDNVTPIAKFDLKDVSGAATFTSVFERIPV